METPANRTRRRSSSAPDLATKYARDVGAGKIVAGPLVRLACERHLRDLKEGQKRGLKWNLGKASRAIRFFSTVLRLSGDHEGSPFVLDPSQAFIVGSLFGWQGDDGYRRFRVAYIEEAKGSGKTPMAAGIGLYMLMADGEWRPEVYSAAVDRDQANILFRDAVAMARASADISERVIFSGGAGRENNIAYLEKGGFFRPLASEHQGRGKSGPRVHCALLDEVHEHPTAAMVEFMRAGTKGRKQALIVMITNAGHDKTTVCYQYHEYSRKTLERLEPEENTDHFFGFVCGLDEADDWKDEAVWFKANPLLGTSITHKYLREQVREAIAMPAKQNIVRRLNFCDWTESEAAWLSKEAWQSIEADFTLDSLRGRRCWGGLDLSSKRDLTALSLVFEPGEDGVWDAVTFLWTPLDTLREREDKDRAPYSVWVRDGHLLAIPGRVIDYGWVAKAISDIQEDHELMCIGYDPHKIEYLEAELDDQGVQVNLIPHSQGFYKPKDGIWMPKSVEDVETLIETKRIRVQRNPVMYWCSANAAVDMDEHENKKFFKKRSTGRIDGVVALTMAVGVALQGFATEPSIYESAEFFM